MMVLQQGAVLILAGVAIGLAGAVGLTRLMSTFLHGIQATDPLTFGVATGLLIGAGLLASYLPARRATQSRSCGRAPLRVMGARSVSEELKHAPSRDLGYNPP